MNLDKTRRLAWRWGGWTILALIVTVLLVACGGGGGDDSGDDPAPADFVFPANGYTRLVEYPVDGVRLGQGWYEDRAFKK